MQDEQDALVKLKERFEQNKEEMAKALQENDEFVNDVAK